MADPFSILAVVASMASADPGVASNAELLCMVMDNTRSIAPCILSEVEHSVTIDIKLAGEDAGQVCRQIQISLAKQRMYFDGAKWRLHITTPASGEKIIASCDLPQTPK